MLSTLWKDSRSKAPLGKARKSLLERQEKLNARLMQSPEVFGKFPDLNSWEVHDVEVIDATP